MKIFLLLILMCGGCAKRMTNDDIIKEATKCEDAGLAAEYGRNDSGEVIGVPVRPEG